MDIMEITKVSNNEIVVTYESGQKESFEVVELGSREESILKAVELTKLSLKREGAINKLAFFRNDFSRHRNYEIEMYLDEIDPTRKYRINEMCPFNNFKWFD